MRFILWDRRDGSAPPREDGVIITSGCLGQLTEDNVYLRSYGKRPEGALAYVDLAVGQCVHNVVFSLSGERGEYDVYRVA